jgi:hypothetical protein
MLFLYLGGMIPAFLFFLVITQPFAHDRHDALTAVASAFLISVGWPFACVYLIAHLYQNRR